MKSRVRLTPTQQAVLQNLAKGGQLHTTTKRAWLIDSLVKSARFDNFTRLRELELIEVVGAQGAVTAWRISYRGRNLLARGKNGWIEKDEESES